jgi:hypothetical protein
MAVIEIGQQRSKIVEAVKEALLRGDEDEAFDRAREPTGVLVSSGLLDEFQLCHRLRHRIFATTVDARHREPEHELF